MQARRVVGLSCLAVSLPLLSVSAQDTPPEPPKWSFSLGVDPTNLNLDTRDPGVEARMVANLTRSWESTNRRLGRHIALMVGTDAPRQMNMSSDPQCCWIDITRRYAALTAGVSYNLFSASRFTPYLKAGTGLYYTAWRREPADGNLTPAELGYYPNGFGRSGFSLGANGGLGIKMRLGSRELFLEQILHWFDPLQGMNTGVYPLNFGLRF
jgi:hypothetical protein